jgi:hypothetical protein
METMELQPCTECKAEISSQERFCPRCGYTFNNQKEFISPSKSYKKRPLGFALGVSICAIGALLLFPSHPIMTQFYFGQVIDSIVWKIQLQLYPMWLFPWLKECQILGLILLSLGKVQLIFGSTKKEVSPIV